MAEKNLLSSSGYYYISLFYRPSDRMRIRIATRPYSYFDDYQIADEIYLSIFHDENQSSASKIK